MPAFENPNDLPQRPKVEPLKSRTMTLSELQLETLDLIRKLRFQLRRPAHAEGMSDEEFLEHIVEPLETTIYQDREMLKNRWKNP